MSCFTSKSLHNNGGVQTSLLSPQISALESDGVFYSLPVAPDLRPLLPPLPGQFRAKIESSLDFSGSSEEGKKDEKRPDPPNLLRTDGPFLSPLA